jgi:type VI secretion system secreted protein Hcp
MPILVKYPDVKGESKLTGFADHFEVSSFQFGVGRGISSAYGTSTREGSVVSVSEITMTKTSDGTTIKLFEEALHGELDNKVEIKFVRTGKGNTPVVYFSIELEGCGVSGFSMSSGGDRPTESLSLNFDKVKLGYSPVGDDLDGKPVYYSWDLATAKGA